MYDLKEEDFEFNQDYELKAKTLKEKDNLTIKDCLWLEYNYFKKKGIILVRNNKQNIEVKNFLSHTPLMSFEFDEENLNDSYIKIVKLCLDFLCHPD